MMTERTTAQWGNSQPRAESPSWSVRSRRSFRDTRAPRTVWRAMAGVLVLVTALAGGAGVARADGLISNANGPTNTHSFGSFVCVDVSVGEIAGAQKFTTGPNDGGYALSSVVVYMADTPALATPRVSIDTAGTDGNPGTSLYTLSNPSFIIEATDQQERNAWGQPQLDTTIPRGRNYRYWNWIVGKGRHGQHFIGLIRVSLIIAFMPDRLVVSLVKTAVIGFV